MHPRLRHLPSVAPSALAFALAFAPTPLRAEEIPEFFTPVRPSGMGGAFTAVANDDNSVWTNPAGISRARKARSRSTFSLAKVPNIIVGANAESRTFYQGFSNSQDKSVDSIVDRGGDLGDKPFWARAAIFPVVLFDAGRNAPMSAGVYSNSTAKAVVDKDDPSTASVGIISDVGGVLGTAFTDDANRFGIGLQIRPVARFAYENASLPSGDLLDKGAMKTHIKDESNKSQGLGIDFGMMYTVADFWFPTVGLAVLNLPTGCRKNYLNPFTEKLETVCGNVYHGDFTNEDALSTVDPTDVRVGVAITPRLTRKLNMRLAVDAHNLPVGSASQSYGLQGIEASKLLHAGVEFFVGNPLTVAPFSLRVGYGQGFVSAGATIGLGFVTLEFATYGRDVSATEKPIEDRRYLVSLALDL